MLLVHLHGLVLPWQAALFRAPYVITFSAETRGKRRGEGESKRGSKGERRSEGTRKGEGGNPNWSTFNECELVLEKSSDLLNPHVSNCSTARLCGRGRENGM